MAIFSIDGVSFDIPVVSVKRESSVLDKYATRTEHGDRSEHFLWLGGCQCQGRYNSGYAR